MQGAAKKAARIFVSYSHDSPEQKDRLLQLADRLCAEGVDAHIDQYEHPPPPSAPRWMMNEIEAAVFVLVVCTETYHRRFPGHEELGKGKGADWEGAIITLELYNAKSATTKFIPIIFNSEDTRHIPTILSGGTHYLLSSEEDYQQPYRVLTNQPAVPKPQVGPVIAKPPVRPAGRGATPIPQEQKRPNNLPFPPNPHFTGRKELLEELHRKLAEKPAAAITQPQAIHGLGGVGKTQLAVEYASKYCAEHDAVLWVVADSPENVAANLAALARSDMLNLPEAAAQEQEVQVEAVRRWLREHGGWLLIFDSVDTEEAAAAVRNLLPPAPQGHGIVTSRRTDWPLSISTLPVNVLPEAAAADFLHERVSSQGFDPGQREDARTLARELGGLPLALEQAAAYIVRYRITFADYLVRLNESRGQLLKQEVEGSTRYPKPVAETWLTSEKQLGLAARTTLRLAAFLAPDDIPRQLFTTNARLVEAAVRALATEHSEKPPNTGEARAAEDALVELAEHSLITLTPTSFSCHRLVQAVQSDRLATEARRRWTEVALLLVNAYATGDPSDVRAWPLWESLRVHVERVVRNADRLGIAEPTARLLNQLAAFLDTKALYREAEPLVRRALAIDEKSFGPDHTNVATHLNNLAQLLKATNRFTEAEPLMKRALAIDEKSFGPDHTKVAIRLNNLAQLLHATNRLTEAEPLMIRALTIDEKSLGPDHPKVATHLNNLATLLQATNRLAEAEPLKRRALAIDKESFGPDHPKVATDLNNLAQLLKANNRLAEAEPLMRQVIIIFRKFRDTTGHEHPNMQAAVGNYRGLLQSMGLSKKEIERRVKQAAGL